VILVPHGSEINYVYGEPDDQSASSLRISKLMIDYWVSFATSLNPNDGKGLERTFFNKSPLSRPDNWFLKVHFGNNSRLKINGSSS